MVTTFKWTGWTDRSASTGGTISTELNSLANGAFSAVSGIYDNTTNLDEWAIFVIDLASLATDDRRRTCRSSSSISLDGTNFEDAAAASNPGSSSARSDSLAAAFRRRPSERSLHRSDSRQAR
jgi:hypothetical protein